MSERMVAWRRWAVLGAILLAAILIPFALVGARLEAVVPALARLASPTAAFAAVVGLLAADIVLPTPSSVVSTLAGTLLGLPLGTLASTLGMTLGALAGYAVGRAYARPLTRRLVGDVELAHAERLARRAGQWAVVVARPVPVLAEASVVLAGVQRMPLPRFTLLTSLSNLGISLVYASAGASAATRSLFLVAFVVALGLPALGMLAAWAARRRHGRSSTPQDEAAGRGGTSIEHERAIREGR